jgi:predicted negative regulator of RcsB-dependent stress response
MATALDLQEQEQIDDLKAFWSRWGNLISGVLIVALLAYAGWNGWNWYQRDQGAKASILFDQLDRAASAGDADRSARIFEDLKKDFPRTVWTAQAGLVVARVQADKGQWEAAQAALRWVAASAKDESLQVMAALRESAVLLQLGRVDEALALLDKGVPSAFEALAADRRGDAWMIKGDTAKASETYQKAWVGLKDSPDYRQLVEIKLTALGAAPSQP